MSAHRSRFAKLAGNRRAVVGLVGVLVVAGAASVSLALSNEPDAVSPTTAADVSGAVGSGLGRDERSSESAPRQGPVLPASVPVTVAIPAIGVDSPLQLLGQEADGTLEVPAPGPHYDEAGWYQYSPTPGELGPAVLVGHIDSAANGPSVFFRLASVRAGDTVDVTRTDGSVAVFEVDEVRSFPKTEFPTELVYGNTSHAALRVISCGGPFNSATGHYRDNVVVFASLIGSKG